MPLIKPTTTPKVLEYSKTEKHDFAQVVEKQSVEILNLLQQKHGLMSLLVAVVRNPDAIATNEEGDVEIDVEAIVELKENTHLQTRRQGDKLILTVKEATYILHAEPGHFGVTVM